ncbi:MAG: PfkB family carbohydrate kinase [bacterium]
MGIMPVDFLYTVPALPEPGEKTNATALIVQGGGPVPNTLVGLSRLGMTTAMIAAVGHDWAGDFSIDELKREKVANDWVIRKKKPSATAVGLIESGSGRRTIALHRDLFITPGDLRLSSLPSAQVVHIDGRDLPACIKLARWGRRVGAQVSLDVGSIRNDVSALFPLVDQLVVADAFALPFTGSRSARAALQALAKICRGTIVITEGTRGAVGHESGQTCRQRAFQVAAVDTTGAGDSFHAGYLFGLLSGFSLPERLLWGCATAALKCTRPGARTGAPTRAAVRKFLKNSPRMYA